MRSAPGLGQSPCGGLAEAVSAASVQARGSALVTEPIAKSRGRVGLPLIGEQEG